MGRNGGFERVERALRVTRNEERKSPVVDEGQANEVELDFTERVLLSLVFDVTCLAENVERVKVQVLAMAREKGIPIPKK